MHCTDNSRWRTEFATRVLSWCDQKESWSIHYPQRRVSELVQEAQAVNSAMIVVTGGEPLMHDLSFLTQELRLSRRVHLETSGAYPLSGEFDWVTFSPKRFKPPHESIYKHVDELKVVVVDVQDLQWAEEQAAKIPAEAIKYLQPEWSTLASQELVLNYVMEHPEWRVSLQTHKFLGVR